MRKGNWEFVKDVAYNDSAALERRPYINENMFEMPPFMCQACQNLWIIHEYRTKQLD
jgi:hypothetical protein